MSIVEVKVPELSESVSEASLIEWKKKVGEPVKADEILIEIETDKIVLEIPAPADGVLASIEQPDGAAVLSDQLIATIDTEGMVGAQPEAPKAAVAEEVIISTPAAAPAPTPSPAAPTAAASTPGCLYDACRRKTHGKQRIVCNSGCRNRRRRTYHETRCHRCLKERSACGLHLLLPQLRLNRPLLNPRLLNKQLPSHLLTADPSREFRCLAFVPEWPNAS